MKRGSVLDAFAVTMLALGTIAAFIVIYWAFASYATPAMNTAFDSANNSANVTTAKAILSKTTQAQASIGYMLPFFFIGLYLVAIILAFLIPSHPVFFPITVILLMAFTVFTAFAGNAIEMVLTQTILQDTTNAFPLLWLIVDFAPWLLVIFGFAIVIAQSSNPAVGGGLRRSA